jgi:hypothetical protein
MNARWTSLLLAAAILLATPLAAWAQAVEEVRAETPSAQAESRISSIRKNEYFYQSYGRRDLCAALVTGEFEPITDPEIVDVNTAKLVGVIWGATDRFAMVEDGQGNGFILRVGDKVRNGRVVAVHEESLVAQVTLYGMTSRVVLKLENREGKR